MRVSDRATYELQRGSLMRNKSQWVKAQERASSGRRVTKPSDDPLATTQAIRERANEQRAIAHQRNIDAGATRLDAADGALESVADVMRQVQELTMQASTDTIGASERASIATIVRGLRDAVHSLANSESNGSYIFAGYPDDAPPFDAAGVYGGSNDVPEYDVSPGIRLEVGVPGDEAFSGVGGGVDVFATLDALVVALEADDMVGIQASIDTVDAAHRQVVDARAEIGVKQDALDVSSSLVERMRDRAITRQSELIGVDQLDAFSELEQAQRAFESAVAIASQLPGPSLVGS